MCFRGLWTDESGATAVEYGLMLAAIAAAVVAIAFTLGVRVEGLFEDMDTKLASHMP